jgi:hypothetical protein
MRDIDFIAEEIFLMNDPVMQEVRAELWPDPTPEPHGAREVLRSERRGLYTCRLCGQRTMSCDDCSAGTDDGPCEASVCLFCGYSCLEWGSHGLFLRWHCRTCGPPGQEGRCPVCQTSGAWYQVAHLRYCTICEYRSDLRLFWGA